MGSEALFIFIAAATVIYWVVFYRFMKETGQMKDERGRRINQIASERTLIILQVLLLIAILAVDNLEWLDPAKVLALIYVVAIFGHALMRYHYSRVM
ncbi:hypothetical protein GQS_09320 [Thermococcus sp. 4557]|uniref:DUF2178 domain-containing protein n=1 Tax=Thermococcus sp. (strain CGMCC 1.5172 / 4557) TaxID=1042877 RepID=UPI000219E7FE|nr:DUF2178 domain-containing protein [Thermococcus sp. 4557]AEK73758.1 hypothetical protein GQS_09320 [Thermococcus sp. 4557]